MPLMTTPAWHRLERLADEMRRTHLRDLFAADARRFEHFSLNEGGLLLDYSKQRVTTEIMTALRELWLLAGVPEWIDRLRRGEPLNSTEGRAVLHFALRHGGPQPILYAGQNIMPAVHRMLDKMAWFCDQIRHGHWRGTDGETICHIVNLGVGGSDLGPRMATLALAAHHQPGLTVDYVSNLDATELTGVLKRCAPGRTLFIVTSKTFTTEETLQNARSARAWMVSALGEAAVARHFVAVTANPEKAVEFGIPTTNIFEFRDWVGGRFSIWSAVGLPLALAIGMDGFRRLLAGAATMDEHFFVTPVEHNLPATLALLELWNTDFLGAETRALLPYSQSLELLPRYLQQLEMESNGKQIDRDGNPVTCATAPILWGTPGTDGQHAFYQLLHQGGRFVPCEFIALREPGIDLPGHHEKLLANCFAQSEALMRGMTLAEASVEPQAASAASPAPSFLARYKVLPGNQPSTTLLLPRLTPHTLGQLIALYEHKVFVLGVLWHINSFDQWGVEHGKRLARRLLPMLAGTCPLDGLDSSTAGLIAACRTSS